MYLPMHNSNVYVIIKFMKYLIHTYVTESEKNATNQETMYNQPKTNLWQLNYINIYLGIRISYISCNWYGYIIIMIHAYIQNATDMHIIIITIFTWIAPI